MAAGTAEGLYLSRDSAESFEPLFTGQQVLAVSFDLGGKQLWFSSYAGKAALMRVALAPQSKPESLPIPEMGEDAIAYIAQNPVRRNELVIATYKRNVFLSQDQGRTWKPIATDGDTHD